MPVDLFEDADETISDHQVFIDRQPTHCESANQTTTMAGAAVFARYAPSGEMVPFMTKSIVTIVFCLAAAVYFTDLDSASPVASRVLPIIDAVLLIALTVWVVLFLFRRGVKQTVSSRSAGGGDWGGFDGGCD